MPTPAARARAAAEPTPIEPIRADESTQTGSASHQALYRRWRSQRFGEVLGQDPIVTTLRNAVLTDRIAHAYLFVGPRGVMASPVTRAPPAWRFARVARST